MLRRLYHDQPTSFSFTPANLDWAQAQITKYPEGRQASAVIPLLWRAQEQEGWLSRPAMEEVARMLGLAYIRVLEVATFYFMFQLQPVGSRAHFQICGTTSCMICGAEDLIAVCKEEIAPRPHELSADGRFSWEEVECLGACANAPMAQVGKDYYEDLSAESFRAIVKRMAEGEVPMPGSQTGRFASEPRSGLTSLEAAKGGEAHNGSVALALAIGDTIRRIDGTEVPLVTPWVRRDHEDETHQPTPPEAQDARGSASGHPEAAASAGGVRAAPGRPAEDMDDDDAAAEAKAGAPHGTSPEAAAEHEAEVQNTLAEDAAERADSSSGDAPASQRDPLSEEAANLPDDQVQRPEGLDAPRGGTGDDLKRIRGVGPKLEDLLHSMGFWHFDQIAGWSAAEIAWVDRNLDGFKGRVIRDRWVAQAKALAAGDATDTGSD